MNQIIFILWNQIRAGIELLRSGGVVEGRVVGTRLWSGGVGEGRVVGTRLWSSSEPDVWVSGQ